MLSKQKRLHFLILLTLVFSGTTCKPPPHEPVTKRYFVLAANQHGWVHAFLKFGPTGIGGEILRTNGNYGAHNDGNYGNIAVLGYTDYDSEKIFYVEGIDNAQSHDYQVAFDTNGGATGTFGLIMGEYDANKKLIRYVPVSPMKALAANQSITLKINPGKSADELMKANE